VPESPIPVALVLTSFEPGGTEHQMTELARRLDPAQFAVHLACLRDQGAFRARIVTAGLPITEFRLPTFASLTAVRQLMRFASWCRHRRIRLVHACDFYANILALPAAYVGRVPVRIGSRRDVMMPERSRAQARLQTVAYRCAHRVIANSAAAAAQLRIEGVAARKIVTIANGLDLERGSRTRIDNGPVVRTIANLRPGKGHEILIEAAAEVRRRCPQVTFGFVGDGSRRAELEHLVDSRGLTDVIRFEGHQSNVKDVLANTDVFAFPSFMEASPNAVLEAMAASVPVVACNVGGIPEVVKDGQNGLLVPPRDAQQLADAILRLLSDVPLATRLGQGGRATVEASFGFDRMVREFEALYRDELAKRSPRPLVAVPASSRG
jgi:glycosyltransferase involved in cell wall biosynthesis